MKIIVIFCLMLATVSSWAGTFRDNFDDGDLQEWDQLAVFGDNPGKWWVADGEVCFESLETPSGIIIGEPDWTDYEIGVDAKIVKNSNVPGAQHLEAIGIIARRTSEGEYGFFIGLGGGPKLVLATRLNGNDPTMQDASWKQQNWELDTWYHLKLVASGSRFSFYVDEKLALEYFNDVYPAGKVGLVGVWSKTDARFDNFSVTGTDVPDANANSMAVTISKDKLATTWGQIKQPK